MKTFKQFNENITHLLTGKSDEEIKKEIDKINSLTKLDKISRYDLPVKWKPSLAEIKVEIDKLNSLTKLDKISEYDLPVEWKPSINELKPEIDNLDYFSAIAIIDKFNLPINLKPKYKIGNVFKNILNIIDNPIATRLLNNDGDGNTIIELFDRSINTISISVKSNNKEFIIKISRLINKIFPDEFTINQINFFIQNIKENYKL